MIIIIKQKFNVGQDVEVYAGGADWVRASIKEVFHRLNVTHNGQELISIYKAHAEEFLIGGSEYREHEIRALNVKEGI